MQDSILLDLSAQRRIVINDRGHRYTFTVNRITPEHWFRYFANIVSSSEQKGDEPIASLILQAPA